MAWSVSPVSGTSVKYKKKGDYYESKLPVQRGACDLRSESGAYKTTDDVATYQYTAESEHGTFFCTVTARRKGLDCSAEIEEVFVTPPEACEIEDNPDFEVIQEEDDAT
ncbi:hypothetical protein [Stenotrophomonas sp.]|uniref:hypothetical protein n=1 Tax=Stenotrophomonas sp. TaxID=69392 RepID=UPI0025DB2148|nr:hypothetical protein [Stenotrophomonas sp.]